MKEFLIPIEPFVKTGVTFTHNYVRCDLDYDKVQKGPVLNFCLVEVGSDRFVKFSIFGSPRHRLLLESWKVNNKKKLADLGTELQTQLKARSGRGWDELVKFSEQAGFKLKG